MRFHSQLMAFVATLASGATPAASQTAIDVRAHAAQDSLVALCAAVDSEISNSTKGNLKEPFKRKVGGISQEITGSDTQQVSWIAPCTQEHSRHLVDFKPKDQSIDTTPQNTEDKVIDDLDPIKTNPDAYWGGKGIWEDSQGYCQRLLDFLSISSNLENFRYADNGEKVSLETLSTQSRTIAENYIVKTGPDLIVHSCSVFDNSRKGYYGISCAKIVSIDRPDVFASVYNQTLKDMQDCLLPAGWEQNSSDHGVCVPSGEVTGACIRSFYRGSQIVWLYSNKVGPLYAVGIQTNLGHENTKP